MKNKWIPRNCRGACAAVFSAIAGACLFGLTQFALGAPRAPLPPFPHLALLFSESFNEPYGFPTNQVIDSAIFAESWSGWALSREQSVVQPWVVPMVATNGSYNVDPARGALRLWVRQDWNSSSTGLGTGPGQTAIILTLVSTNATTQAVWWSLLASADGNELSLVCQTAGGPATCLGGAVSWQAGEWHLLTVGYTPTNSTLY